MSRIYVQFAGLEQIGTGCKTAASRVDAIETEFWQTIQALDWDVRYEADINSTAKQISRKLEKQAKALKDYQKFIANAYDEYVKLDEYRGLELIDNKTSMPSWLENATFKLIDALITKPYVLPGLLPMVSPITGLLYITSGIYSGNTPSFFDYSRTPCSDTGADWLGYEVDGTKVTAWGGKAYAEIQNEAGYAGVNAYLGKIDTGVKSNFSFMESKYENGEWTEEFLNAEIEAGVDVSILAADGEAGVGNDMLGAEIEGEGSVGNAELSGKGEFSVGEDGIELNAKGKAMVSAVEGEAEGTINILGLEITVSAGGYAGAIGVEGEIGIDDGKFKIKGGAAAGIGGSVGIEVGFNETGWANFVDGVTFWD